MSREILFKAKRKNWREIPKEEWWIEGLPIEIKEKLYISTEYDGIDDKTDFGMVQFIIQKSLIEIDPETLCQYTGLNDKNGKKIWENDIVDGHTKRGAAFWRSVVLWNEYKARFDVRTMDCNFPMTLDEVVDDISVNGPDYVVIGNIFDNPELLEDSDLKEKKM